MTNINAEIAESLFEEDEDEELSRSIASLPTEDDLPCDDGVPMETPRHRDQMILLIESLKAYWGEDKRYYVGGNMFLHYELSGSKKFRGPDVFLVMDVENRERKSWVVWQEGMRFPDVIIELLSDSTRTTDKTVKKELYSRIFRTPEYYIYDPFSQEFEGFWLKKSTYESVQPDKEKRIYSSEAGLYLVIKDDWLRWMTPDGHVLPTHLELYRHSEQKLESAEQKIYEERQRAEDAEKLLEKYRRRYGEL
ncbi:Uma2 family endonuclease [Desulfonema magnum]|uniref:Restriction endonuclease domain-containing and DUF820 n=1 Tax=Desulfonema magnum TaxID=45655 RepID=A0A975BSY6_9BACT|nr:Uma2 family endonuclease [Desulfonema magnum]QTA90813.1 restriction endonuclease domain-containing and DUF820 [Desulfonema magnum]